MLAIVSTDGQTISPLSGCRIVNIPDGTPVEEIAERAEIIYTFRGDETSTYPDAIAALRREGETPFPQQSSASGSFDAGRGRALVCRSESLRPRLAGEPAGAIRDAISDLRAYAQSIGAEIGE